MSVERGYTSTGSGLLAVKFISAMPCMISDNVHAFSEIASSPDFAASSAMAARHSAALLRQSCMRSAYVGCGSLDFMEPLILSRKVDGQVTGSRRKREPVTASYARSIVHVNYCDSGQSAKSRILC